MTNPQPIEDAPFADAITFAALQGAKTRGELDGIGEDLLTIHTRLIASLVGSEAFRPVLTAMIVDTVKGLPREVKYVPAVGKVSFTPRVVRPMHWWTKVAVGALLGFLVGVAFLTWVLNPGTIQFFGVTGLIGDVVDTWGFETIVLLCTTGFGGLWGMLFAGKARIWIDIEAPDMNTGSLVFVDSVPVNN